MKTCSTFIAKKETIAYTRWKEGKWKKGYNYSQL
jgi:hypothetical protein